MLSQIRAVYSNQLMCVWIHGRTLVRLRVGKYSLYKVMRQCICGYQFLMCLTVAQVDPESTVVKLTTNSEVIVAPKVRKMAKPVTEVTAASLIKQKTAPHVCLRSLPLAAATNIDFGGLEPVMVHPDSLDSIQVAKVVRISKVMPVFMRQKGGEESGSNKDQLAEADNADVASAKAIYATLVLSDSIPRDHVLVGNSIRNTLDIKDFDIVK